MDGVDCDPPPSHLFNVSTLLNVSGLGWLFKKWECPAQMSRATDKEASALALSLATAIVPLPTLIAYSTG
jgi:hypothetical protein